MILQRIYHCSHNTAAEAVERVVRRLKFQSPDEVTWNCFEDERWHFWVQTAPGIKDYSGRPTILFHILMLDKVNAESVVSGKDFFIFSKFQQESPADHLLVDDIMVSEEELFQSPTVKFQRNICRKRLSVKAFFIIFAAILLLVAVFVCIKNNSDIQAAVDYERNRNIQQHAKEMANVAEHIGLKTKNSRSITPQMLKDHIDKYYVKKSEK